MLHIQIKSRLAKLFCRKWKFESFYYCDYLYRICCLHSPVVYTVLPVPQKRTRYKIIFLNHKSFCIVIFGCLIIQFNLPMIGSTSIPCLIGWSVLVLAMLDSRTVSGLKSRILWRWAGTYFVLDNFLPISLEESTYN